MSESQGPSAARDADLFDFAPVGYVVLDSAGIVGRSNLTLASLFRADRSRIEGLPLLERVDLAHRGEYARHLIRAQEGQGSERVEIEFCRDDGSIFWGLLTSRALLDRHGRFREILASICDVTTLQKIRQEYQERCREYEVRIDQQRGLAGMLRRATLDLTSAEKRERQALARILHSELQPLLTAAKIKALLLGEELQEPRTKGALEEVARIIGDSIEGTRAICSQLDTSRLHAFGLAASLRSLAQAAEEMYGLSVTVEIDMETDLSVDGSGLVLCDIAVEAFLNVAKHAHVKKAFLSLTRSSEKGICFVVKDEGIGFDETVVLGRRENLGGMGLFDMRDRVESLGGVFRILSEPGRGTEVIVRLPASEPGETR